MFTRSSAPAGGALVALAVLAVLACTTALQAEQSQKMMPASKPGTGSSQMSEYLVIAPHTPQECLAVMDEVAAMGADALAKWDWGCMSGDHTAYIKVQAMNEAEALKAVPASVRGKAKAIRLNQFTIEEIRKFHQSH